MLNRFPVLLFSLCLLAGCSSEPERPVAIAEAYVGPITLNLRQELAPRAPVSATLKHGQRVEILQRRRRFVKVRTAEGATGWTDGQMLLSPDQMAELRRLAELYVKRISQGTAKAYDTVNVHATPNRQAPSFYQIPEDSSVEVIGHKVEPRVPYQPPSSLPQPETEPSQEESSASRAEEPPGVPLDDWSLVRIPDGRAGWVLTRMLFMAIPDEVAQYAEGHRITSYFSLGEVVDGGEVKHHWLWTTMSARLQPYQFDSFRVFVWSLRRHRYETAYIERNLVGYFPVEVNATQVRTAKGGSSMPGFSLIVQGKDGVRYRRTYAFQGYRVRMVDKSPWNPPEEDKPPQSEHPRPDSSTASQGSVLERVKKTLGEWSRRLRGR